MVSKCFYFLLSLLAFSSFSFGAPESFVLQGQIQTPDGSQLEAASVDFTVQIYSPGSDQCLLYEEVFSGVNMTDSKGLFSLAIGTGFQSGSDFEDTSSLNTILNNFSGAFAPTTCESGGPNYTPSPTDGRQVRLTFDDGSGPVTLAQDHTINSVPYAQYAKSIDGLGLSDILKTNSTTAQLTQVNLETVFASPTDASNLRDLIDGSSTNYMVSSPSGSVGFNNQRVTDVAAPTSPGDATNKNYVDANLGGQSYNTGLLGLGDAGEVLTWNGTQWVSQAIAGGDVLDGGNSTGATVSLGTNDTFGLELETNGTTALSIDTSQGVSLAAGLGVTGGVNTGGDINLLTQSELRLQDATGGEYIGFRAPGAVTTPVTFTLPGGDGSTGQLLRTDGSGNLSWVNDANSVFTPASGDYTSSQVDNVAAGDIAATDVQGALNELDAEKLPLAGGTMTGNLVTGAAATLQLTESAGTGELITIAPNADATAPYTLTLPADDGGAGQVLQTDGSGALSWVGIGGGGDFFADGSVAMTGNLNLQTQSALRLQDDVGGDYVALRAPSGVTSYTMELPTVQGTLNQILKSDSSGNLSWSSDADTVFTPASGDYTSSQVDNVAAGDIAATDVQGALNELDAEKLPLAGGTMTGNLNMGTQSLIGGSASGDDLTLESTTNGTKGDIILNASGGNVGVGTTAPAAKLDVVSGLQTLKLGGDTGATTLTDSTEKAMRMGMPHYLATEESVALLISNSQTSTSNLGIGGGSSTLNAVTGIRFYTAADNTTTLGSQRMVINSLGHVGVGAATPGTKLDVEGRITSGPIDATAGNTGSLIMEELAANGTNSVGLRAPDALALDLMWTLPNSLGTANQVLRNSATPGVLEWATPATGTGDFLANGSIPMTGNLNLNGQTLIGGTGSADDLTLDSTSNGTKGDIKIGPGGGQIYIGAAGVDTTLNINGETNFGQITTPPPAPLNSGTIYFDDVTKKFKVSENNGSFVDLLPSSGLGSGDFRANGSIAMTGNLRLGSSYLSGDGDAEGVFVSTDGEVGVGTNSPTSDLTISALLGGSGGLNILDANDSDNLRFRLRTSSPSGHSIFEMSDNSETETVELRSSGDSFLNGGNLGIGTSGPGTKLDVEGRITSGPIDATAGNTGSFVMEELAANGTNSVGLRAPDALALDLMWTLPNSLGTANQVLRNSATPGVLEWATPATGTGDFLANGSIPMTGNLNMGGQSLIGGTASGVDLTLESTANATKGDIFLAPNGGRVAIGNSVTPNADLTIESSNISWGEGLALNPAPNGFTGVFWRNVPGSTNFSWALQRRPTHELTFTYVGLTGMEGTSTPATVFDFTDTGDARFGGNVGVGTSTPGAKIDIEVPNGTNDRVRISNNDGLNSITGFEAVSSRNDSNASYGAQAALGFRRADGTAISSGTGVGSLTFGGQWGTDTTYESAKMLYTASVNGISEGDWTSATAMPTALTFSTGSAGSSAFTPNNFFGIERMRVTSDGNVGIGTSLPTGKLDVADGNITAVFGADTGQVTRTNSTDKYSRIGTVHHDLSEEPVAMLNTESQSSYSNLNVGGGSGFLNAVTHVKFFTAANTTTTGGTERMRISENGRVGIGTFFPEAKLHVDGSGASDGVCVTSDDTCSAVPAGGEISAETTLNTGADYAEYFEAEEELIKGELVGLNPDSGRVRGYQPGDHLLGVVSTDPGVIGNSELRNHPNAILVALVGQVPVDETSIREDGGVVSAFDGQTLGYRLQNGNIYLNLSTGTQSLKRKLASQDKLITEQKAQLEIQKNISAAQSGKIQHLEKVNQDLDLRLQKLEKLLGQ